MKILNIDNFIPINTNSLWCNGEVVTAYRDYQKVDVVVESEKMVVSYNGKFIEPLYNSPYRFYWYINQLKLMVKHFYHKRTDTIIENLPYKSVSVVENLLNMEQSSTSQLLKKCRDYKWVKSVRFGKHMKYVINTDENNEPFYNMFYDFVEEIAKILDNNDSEYLIGLFELFDATETMYILDMILVDEVCVSDLYKPKPYLLFIEESITSLKLKLLLSYGLVTNRREGKQIFYKVSDKYLKIQKVIVNFCTNYFQE